MKIEIKGVEFNNKGAELMLHSIIQQLDSKFDNYQLVLSPGYLLPYEKRARLGAWQKFSFKLLGIDWTGVGNLFPQFIVSQLKHFGIVVEKDIDLVLDASGFAYGDKWEDKVLIQTVNQIKRLSNYKVPYVFLPQAFGPFSKGENSKLMEKAISGSNIVFARDKQSLKTLQEITSDESKVELFPDFTPLSILTEVNITKKLPEKFVCIIPNSKMLNNKPDDFKKSYIQLLTNIIKIVKAKSLTPIILNHEGEKDRLLCLELINTYKGDVIFFDGLESLEIKKIIGLSFFCFSSRFHGCISGLSQGVPTFATSWSHKYEELYEDYQSTDNLIDVEINESDLKIKIGHVTNERESVSKELLEIAQKHKIKNNQMWMKIFEKIDL